MKRNWKVICFVLCYSVHIIELNNGHSAGKRNNTGMQLLFIISCENNMNTMKAHEFIDVLDTSFEMYKVQDAEAHEI